MTIEERLEALERRVAVLDRDVDIIAAERGRAALDRFAFDAMCAAIAAAGSVDAAHLRRAFDEVIDGAPREYADALRVQMRDLILRLPVGT